MSSERARPLLLLADDDGGFRQMLRAYVDEYDCDVLEAKDGAEALETIMVEQPDVVVLDVMMPELSGWEVVRYVKSKPGLASIRVIMLTGIGHETNELTSPLFGADEYIDKDASTELLDELGAAIARQAEARGLTWQVAG